MKLFKPKPSALVQSIVFAGSTIRGPGYSSEWRYKEKVKK